MNEKITSSHSSNYIGTLPWNLSHINCNVNVSLKMLCCIIDVLELYHMCNCSKKVIVEILTFWETSFDGIIPKIWL